MEGWNTFSLIDENAQLILAQIHFHVEHNIASSPSKAPFGSVSFSKNISAEALFHFLQDVEKKLKSKGIRKIHIKDAPHIYMHDQAGLLTVLLKDLGYIITQDEINSSIIIDDALWENKISKDELYHFKRCQRELLTFREMEIAKLVEVYRFIESCRHERKMSLSMTLDQMINTVRHCQTDFLLFGAFQYDEMVAAAISIRVNDRILYDFYYGHSKSSNSLSPVVFLLDGQYTFCQRNGFQILDLGTSSLNGKTNFSLLNFKSQVGGIPSMKLTFEKEL
jgi:hypothetical protein